MSNAELIAEARDYAGVDEYSGAVLLRRLASALEEADAKAALIDEMRELSHRYSLPGVFADVLFDA